MRLNRLVRSVLNPLISRGMDVNHLLVFIDQTRRSWTRPFDKLPLGGIGAEVGVYKGMHAYRILKKHPSISKLWLVDPYAPYGESYEPCCDLQKSRGLAHHIIERHYRHKVEWVEIPSPQCVERLPMLDFCYIDGDHGGDAVREDIAAIWPKIKAGGILGGHDFHPNWPGLITAVIRFAVHTDVQLNVETPDWWVLKPHS